ncbi:MAG: hypothetical protein AB8B95_09385 [Pseudohongiellaceae bacterium]
MPNMIIENLSSRIKLIGLLAPLVLGINITGIVLCLYVLFDLSSAITEKSGTALLEQVSSDYLEFESLSQSTRDSVETVEDFASGIGTSMSESEIVAMTETVMTSETNAQLFLRLLKVNVYNLTGEIPGTASWYEIYAPVIDGAIERSRARQLELLKIKRHYGQEA